MKDNSDYSERAKIQLKRMLDKTTKYPDNNERGVGIKTVSLKRNYRESYPSEGKEEELVRDKQAFNEKQNKNNFQYSIPSSNEVNQQNKQEKYFPSTAKTDFEKRNLTKEELQDKLNSSLKYYQNKSKIVFASEHKDPRINDFDEPYHPNREGYINPNRGNEYYPREGGNKDNLNDFNDKAELNSRRNYKNLSNTLNKPAQKYNDQIKIGNKSNPPITPIPESHMEQEGSRQPKEFVYESNHLNQPQREEKQSGISKKSSVSHKSNTQLNRSQVYNPSNNSNKNNSYNQNRGNNTNQSKQVVVLIKPNNVTDFEITNEIPTSELISSNHLSFRKHSRETITQASIAIIGSGIIFILVLYTAEEEQRNQIINSITSISPLRWAFCGLIIVGSIALYLLYKKNQEKQMYKDIAFEDYELLKKRLHDECDNENFLGIFHSQYIKENAEKRLLPEGKYRKYVMPIICNLVRNNYEIKEAEIIISDQQHKVWRLDNDNNNI